MKKVLILTVALVALVGVSAQAKECAGLPDHNALKSALITARNEANGGLNLDMWATLVDRSGKVCAVAFTGEAVDA